MTTLQLLDRDAPVVWRMCEPVPLYPPAAPRALAARAEGSAGPSLDALRSALAAIPNEGDAIGYDDWRNVVFAIHDATDGSDEGLALAHEFSARSPRHSPDFLDMRVWPSIRQREGGITVRTVLAMAREHGWSDPSVADEFAVVVPTPGTIEPVDVARMADVELGHLLVDYVMAGRFRYEHGARGWLRYADGAWRACAKAEETRAATTLGNELMQRGSADMSAVKERLKLVQRAMTVAGIDAALHIAKADPRIAAAPAEFDRDPDLLNTLNGVVHLPTGELRPHDPAAMMSRQCPVAYERGAHCPQWLRFIDDISMRDADWIGYLHRLCGYVLSGHVGEEVMSFWLGHGANGKSVMANVLRRVMGSYAVSVPPGFLMLSQRDGEGATPSLAMLPGARLALANEVEAGSRLSAQSVKLACSTEAIAARHLYGKVFSFVPTHKLIVRGNHKPIISDNDAGIWRRIHLLPFDRHFGVDERDRRLEDKLMSEAGGILAWMVAGHAEYLRRGLRQSKRGDAASRGYRKESDLIGQWLDDRTEPGAAHDCVQADAYADYQAWCHAHGCRPFSRRQLTVNLGERGLGSAKLATGPHRHAHAYLGFRLLPPEGLS